MTYKTAGNSGSLYRAAQLFRGHLNPSIFLLYCSAINSIAMGILNGILRVKGNVGELVFVNFGQTIYVRRKRGTLKPATVNKKFQQNVDRNEEVMHTAKPIHTIFTEYAGGKSTGRFWTNMLSRIRKCSNDDLETHLESLEDLEIFQNYQLSKRVLLKDFKLNIYKDHFKVDLEFKGHASFKNEENNCYYYELIAILWGKDKEITEYKSIPTPWFYKRNRKPRINVKFERTKWDKYYLLALKLQGGKQGEVSIMMPDKAIAIIGGGLLK